MEEVMKCLECPDVVLEPMRVSCLPGGVGYFCRSCKYIYNMQEYRRMKRELGIVEDHELPRPEDLDPSKVIRIGGDSSLPTQELPDNIKELLTATFAETKNAYSDGIEER